MGASAKQRWPRILTIVALAVGLSIALGSVWASMDSVAFIIVAQGLTTLGLPILALVILWMVSSSKGSSKLLVLLVFLGFAVACYIAGVTLLSLMEQLKT